MAGRNHQRRQRRSTRRRIMRRNGPAGPKAVVNGVLFKPPNNPRTVNPRPWNNYSIQKSVSHTTEASITIGDIVAEVTDVNGLKDSNGAGIQIEIKIISCEIYGTTGQTLNVRFWNLAGFTNTEQFDQCLPARNQFARVGYRWPLSDQSVAFNSDNQGTVKVVALFATGSDGDKALVKFRVLWRAATTFISRAIDVRPANNLETQISRLCDLLSDRLVL